jgi:hypothetical protein
MPGSPVGTVWSDISPVNSQAIEDTGYDTQKSEALLERIIKASSNAGDLVADFFCGSSTTLAVAEKLGRRWIGCDLGRFAVHTTRKRLLGIEGCKPFEILNLGKYERQYWQGVTFGAKGKNITEQALYEYLAFILKLYGAQPLVGLAHLHGKNGKAMVHIGAVGAPVTIDEINAAVAECVQVRQAELHVLGWEWEMGLYDLMVAEAKRQGVKLLLLQIPCGVMEQQAVDKGDIQFFELAYLEVEISRPGKLTATVVSVMMLREGWDVHNVSVVLGLRPFTAKAEILPEQVIGRGLRLMTAIGPDRTQTLEVLGTRNLLNVLRDQLEAEGVGVATTADDPPRPVVNEPVQDRLAYATSQFLSPNLV